MLNVKDVVLLIPGGSGSDDEEVEMPDSVDPKKVALLQPNPVPSGLQTAPG